MKKYLALIIMTCLSMVLMKAFSDSTDLGKSDAEPIQKFPKSTWQLVAKEKLELVNRKTPWRYVGNYDPLDGKKFFSIAKYCPTPGAKMRVELGQIEQALQSFRYEVRDASAPGGYREVFVDENLSVTYSVKSPDGLHDLPEIAFCWKAARPLFKSKAMAILGERSDKEKNPLYRNLISTGEFLTVFVNIYCKSPDSRVN